MNAATAIAAERAAQSVRRAYARLHLAETRIKAARRRRESREIRLAIRRLTVQASDAPDPGTTAGGAA